MDLKFDFNLGDFYKILDTNMNIFIDINMYIYRQIKYDLWQ